MQRLHLSDYQGFKLAQVELIHCGEQVSMSPFTTPEVFLDKQNPTIL